MNNFGGGLSQGRDMVLYNAFDWEHLRKRFVKLPGAARSVPGSQRSPREARKDMEATLDAAFVNATSFKVDNPVKALPTRQGNWHWTAHGFQLAAGSGDRKGRAKLAPSAEGIGACLAERSVTEFYAPVADHPLPLVINPNAPITLERSGFGGMYWL